MTESENGDTAAPKKPVSQELLNRLAKAREAAAAKREAQRKAKEEAIAANEKLERKQKKIVESKKIKPQSDEESVASSTDSSNTSDSEVETPSRNKPTKTLDIDAIREKYKRRYEARYAAHVKFLEAVNKPNEPPRVPREVPPEKHAAVVAKHALEKKMNEQVLKMAYQSVFGHAM